MNDDIDELQRMAMELLDSPVMRTAIGAAGKALVDACYSPATAVQQVIRGLTADLEWN